MSNVQCRLSTHCTDDSRGEYTIRLDYVDEIGEVRVKIGSDALATLEKLFSNPQANNAYFDIEYGY